MIFDWGGKMRILKKKKSFKFHFIIWSILIVFFVSIHIIQKLQLFDYAEISNRINNEIQVEQSKHEQLKIQLEINGTDAFYEKIAREQLNMVKPDEILFQKK
jgi:cell division protein DivIC